MRPAAALATALTLAALALPMAGGAAQPEARPLGEDRYQIGSIIVDKKARRLSVPGTIVDLGSSGAPLEFIAGTRGGMKLYETLIELDTDAVAFNVACILLGLDPKNARPARHHFDPEPVEGMSVDIRVRWRDGDATVEHTAAELLKTGDGARARDDWVYTGSVMSSEGRFLAQEHGVIVGFVHAPESLIEHRSGIGLGSYGAAVLDPDIVPPAGTPVTLIVSAQPSP